MFLNSLPNTPEEVLARFPIDLAQIVTTGHSRGEPEKCASTDFDMYCRHGYDNSGTSFAMPGSDWSDPGFIGAVEATLKFRASASFQ
ncbi:hypothetical protein [Ruegeria sp. THAF33]|uniref:hypothetical protein n=1 Tax=Ruegeria sp. THAF33 TaxID=2587853 RepID=UPI001C12AEEB|nr:hypothetical protein [Ruegeria sp. THAF33]